MKTTILIALLSIILVPALAQTPGFTFGPKVGATFSKFTTDVDVIKEEAKNTIHWGAFARLGGGLYLQPEILFMNRSGVLISSNDPASKQTIQLRTIDVPLLVGVRVANLKLANVRIFAGPVATMVVNRDIKTENWNEGLTEDDIRKANWALQFGAGVDLLVFTVDLRYERGMNDYSKITTESLKNNMVTLSLGWKIL